MHNINLGKEGSSQYESRFGFSIETCCGSIPQRNAWDSSWTVRDYTKYSRTLSLSY